MLDIQLGDIINAIGQPTKKTGHQYYFRCPVCQSRGEDTTGDNLLFNDNKKILKCFACDEGSKEVLRLINECRSRNCTSITQHQVTRTAKKWYEVNKENLLQYLFESIDELSSTAIKYLQGRCISTKIAELCGIGYDSKPNMVSIGSSITFPMFSLNHNEQLVGFELRELGTKKNIKHTLDSPSCICITWGSLIRVKHLVITEGFVDAYSLLELLKNRRPEDYLIATGSHGCKSILPSLSGIDFSRYENCYLILDNDDAGEQATRSILNEYSFFKDKRSLLRGCKDINEYLCQKRAGYYQ